jgi:ABC-type branched-subunit amino acid transport system substrate-binding protein
MRGLKRWAWAVLATAGSTLILSMVYAAIIWKRLGPIRIAFANSLTGSSSSAGTESLTAAQLHVDEVNAAGGVDGRRIELVMFDDASSADLARDNVQAIATSSCLAVLGHYLSTTSLAAGTGYKFVGIPALTGTAFVDDLTYANEYYFRAQTTSSVQGRSNAEYLRAVLKAPVVHLVYSRDQFGRSFVRGFAQGYQQQQLDAFAFDVDPDARGESIREMVEGLANKPEPGIIIVGTGADYIAEVVKAVRRRGLTVPIMTAGGAGREEFLQQFADELEEKQHPGFFSEKLYAPPPLIFDSASVEAQAFASAYARKSGRPPDWIAAASYDAMRVMIEAVRRAQVQNRPETKQADRERVHAALANIKSPQTAVAGLTGPLYFDTNRDMPNAVRVGFFRLGRFITAPLQLVSVDPPEAINLAEERAKGRVVSFGNRHY